MLKDELKGFQKIAYKIKVFLRNIEEYKLITNPENGEKCTDRLNDILEYATNHCDYYKNLQITDLKIENFPILTKKIIRENFDGLVSNEKNKLQYRESYTGGSTGEPLHFYNQMNFDAAYQVKFWKLMGYKLGDRILSMDGTKVSKDKIARGEFWGKKSKINLPYGGYFLSSLYMTSENIGSYVGYIRKLCPALIRGYPIFIYAIAKYIIDNDIQIDFPVKGIQLTSESSFPYQHEVIAQAFKTKIFMQYGHTECCVFGYTFNSTLKYKIEPLYGYVEILDEHNKPVSVGCTGEVVVTSYFNKIMPLIRYKTGDFAKLGEPIDGLMVLDSIYGRTQDYIVDMNGNKVMITALVMGQHFKAMGHIAKWQIEQTAKGKVTMRIIQGKDWEENDEIELIQLFGEHNINIDFEYTDVLPLTQRGKSMLIRQHL